MWRIPYFGAHCEALVLRWHHVKHCLAGDESGGAERDRELIASAVVIPDGLHWAFWDGDAVQRGHARWIVFVKRSVDVPAVETGISFLFLLLGQASLVKGGVRRVLERGGRETLVIVDHAVSDELDLGNTGNGLEIGVENRFLGRLGLVVSVSISLRFRVKCLGIWRSVTGLETQCRCRYLGQGILLLWGERRIPEKESTVLVERISCE